MKINFKKSPPDYIEGGLFYNAYNKKTAVTSVTAALMKKLYFHPVTQAQLKKLNIYCKTTFTDLRLSPDVRLIMYKPAVGSSKLVSLSVSTDFTNAPVRL